MIINNRVVLPLEFKGETGHNLAIIICHYYSDEQKKKLSNLIRDMDKKFCTEENPAIRTPIIVEFDAKEGARYLSTQTNILIPSNRADEMFALIKEHDLNFFTCC